jgi:hypothetical protein
VDPILALVTADEALGYAKAAAERDELYFRVHASERMQQRIATHADVRNAITTADTAVESPKDGPDRWLICGGCDLDDCGLRVLVAIDEDYVVTVSVVSVWP